MIEKINNLQIQLNQNIIKRLKAHDLYVDHMGTSVIILLALQEARYGLLDLLDDNNKNKRIILLYRQLEFKGLIEPAEKINYKLTKKAEILLKFIKSEYQKENLELALKDDEVVIEPIIQPVAKQVNEQVSDWIEQYINLFPEKYRDHPRTIIPRMQNFMLEYGYDKETILGATKMYIREQEDKPEGHQYTRKSIYFVFKGSGDAKIVDLATWCKKYTEKDNHNSYDTRSMDMA